MRDVLYLAWRYLAFNRWKTVTLVAAVTTIIFLPLALELVLDRSADRLRARAQGTPLLLGAPGSPLELVLGTLYFDGKPVASLNYAAVTAVDESGLALAIPLVLGHRVGSQPVVGTTTDYFGFRGLSLAAGRLPAISGEAVLGARAAAELATGPGGSVVTSPETVFDVTGTYPLKLNITGVLAATGTPDDDAVFVDLRTAWIIGGLGHGHEDLQQGSAAGKVLARDADNIVANAAVVQYREITPQNLREFHFHGARDELPVSGVIAVPRDEKSGVLLEGRYEAADSGIDPVRPATVIEDLLATVFTVRQYLLIAVGLVSLATVATLALVFLLSVRLRRAEIHTMTRIGAAPGRIAAVLAAEVGLVLVFSALLALLLTTVTAIAGDSLFRWLLLAN